MRNFYRIGDKVKLKPSSQYYGRQDQIPKDSYGVINSIRDSGVLPILVTWDSGEVWYKTNAYKLSDLTPY